MAQMVITQKQRNIIKTVVVIGAFSLLINMLLPSITSQEFRLIVQNLGMLAPIVVILYTVVSHVLAPVAGSPAIVLSMAVFGIYETVLYLYIASLISATINFWISRTYGRKWVSRFVGNDVMSQLDGFTKSEGKGALWVARIFGFTLFELVSYAYGFTNMRYKDYMLITIFGSIPSSLLIMFAFRNISFESTRGLYIWVVSLVVTGTVLAYFINKYIKKIGKI